MSTKSFNIPRSLINKAWLDVKSNAGSSGIDDETIAKFELNLDKNLYKLWNRMASGSYIPKPVKSVSIPKKDGSERILGIPTVLDRIAQTVAKMILEPQIEPYFYKDSYGYRPNKSALDAIGITRKRCWYDDWVLEFDIKGLFDNIDHEMLMKAVKKYNQEKWIILYIERWLKCPMQDSEGKITERGKGTPQGGVISPILANLFMHYAFDRWISKNHPENKWCRYADDGLIHCKTEESAQKLLSELKIRMLECKLEVHPKKTKIIYCKDSSRKKDYPNTKFEFLGYEFRRRLVKNNKRNSLFVSFTPSISNSSLKSIKQKLKGLRVRKLYYLELQDVANIINPALRGWINYYGKYNRSGLYTVFRQLNHKLVLWSRRKYKKLRRHKTQASEFMMRLSSQHPKLFAHWSSGMTGSFA